uniref:Autophagy-related protein n=1 Tax=Panagrolaimus sp. JU765 TaxID=591449 RepID=A0AC34Q104_9BILA
MSIFGRICTGPSHKALPLDQRFHSPKCFYFPDAPKKTSDPCLSNILPRNATYREKLSFCCRKSESSLLLSQFEDKIPVIIQRFKSEKRLPELDNCQFVVPKKTTVGQLQHIIKQRLGNFKNSAIYVLVANRELPCLTTTVAELYSKFRDDDGFLYISFSSEDCYG